MSLKNIEHFIETFVKELEEENVAIFAGAGLSVGAGYVDWKKLLQPIAQELDLDIDQEHDLISMARYRSAPESLFVQVHEWPIRFFGDVLSGRRF